MRTYRLPGSRCLADGSIRRQTSIDRKESGGENASRERQAASLQPSVYRGKRREYIAIPAPWLRMWLWKEECKQSLFKVMAMNPTFVYTCLDAIRSVIPAYTYHEAIAGQTFIVTKGHAPRVPASFPRGCKAFCLTVRSLPPSPTQVKMPTLLGKFHVPLCCWGYEVSGWYRRLI